MPLREAALLDIVRAARVEVAKIKIEESIVVGVYLYGEINGTTRLVTSNNRSFGIRHVLAADHVIVVSDWITAEPCVLAIVTAIRCEDAIERRTNASNTASILAVGTVINVTAALGNSEIWLNFLAAV